MTPLPRSRIIGGLMGETTGAVGQPVFEVAADHPDRPRRVTYAVLPDGTVLRSPGTGSPCFYHHGRTAEVTERGLLAYAIEDGATPRHVFYREEASA